MGSYEQETQRQDGDKRLHIERLLSVDLEDGYVGEEIDVRSIPLAVFVQDYIPLLLSSLDAPEQRILRWVTAVTPRALRWHEVSNISPFFHSSYRPCDLIAGRPRSIPRQA